jgi:RNA polymerase sigma factor (sigma-70 family)
MLVATAPITDFLQSLRANRFRDEGSTDGRLLEVFTQSRDDGAFEALLRRHGPMVLGVCRRILRNNHDAEDAFQATFLVLACKAGVVRPRHMVAGWLYNVACNTALKLRGTLARRRVKEEEAAAMPRPQPPADAWRQLEPLLDDAVRGLPDKYRSPIVLCDLEGKSRKEAARQLGWPEGTVASRLARARQILSRRLARHGLALSGIALAAVVAQNQAAAAVPPALVKSLTKIGPLIAAGEPPAACALSGRVAQLTQGVLQAMLMTKLKIAMALFLVLSFFAVAATIYPTSASPQATPPPQRERPKDDKAPPDQAREPKSSDQRKGAAPVTLELPAVVIDEVDLKYKTISVTIVDGLGPRSGTSSSSGTTGRGGSSSSSTSTSDKPAKLVDLPVDKNVEIYVDNKIVPLGSLKTGMKVALRLTERDGRLVAATIGTGPRGGDQATELELKLKEAKAQVDVARANVEVAAVALQRAKLDLANAQEDEARAKARAAVQAAEAQVQLSLAVTAEVQVRAERIAREYEEARMRKSDKQPRE